MIPLIEDAVLKHNWLSESDFINFIGVCESTPGPIAVNLAAYIGSIKTGILGLIIATGITLLITCLGYESLNSFDFDFLSLICLGILVLIYLGMFFIFKKKINTITLILISIVVGIAVCGVASII